MLNKNLLKLVLFLFLSAIIVISIVQNLSTAPVKFLLWNFRLPVIAIIITCLFAGFLLGLICYSLIFKRPSVNKTQDLKKMKGN